MSTPAHDVIVIGGGHNGLVAAAYLARARRSVLVLERLSTVGGSVVTADIAPGFRGPLVFSGAERFHPRIINELRLARHGLEVIRPVGGTFVPIPDSQPLYLQPSGVSPSSPLRLSDPDQAALEDLRRFVARIDSALGRLLTGTLPRVAMTNALGWLATAWRLRRLGPDEMPEVLRFLPMPVQDVVDERFDHEALKAALAAPGLNASWLGPRSAGSAFGLLQQRPVWSGGLLAAPRFVARGPGALSEAIAAAARDAGAQIRLEAEVAQIVVEQGRATGVVLASGEQIRSHIVVSGLDPKRTLLDLVEPGWLDPEQRRAVTNLRARGSVAVVRLALDRAPRFVDAPADESYLWGRIQIGASLEYLERAYDAAKYGRVPEKPLIEPTIPSLADPALAPRGKHVALALVQFTPRQLRSSTWHEARERLGDTVVALITEHAPGFDDSVLHREVLTPEDIERRLGLTGGCLYHLEPALDQALLLRPLPGWYRYRSPLPNLYLCGPGTHPGGGVTGLPGRNAARRVLAELRSLRRGSAD